MKEGLAEPLLRVEGLVQSFVAPGSWLKRLCGEPAAQLRAVDAVSFEIRRGETLGLIGESGCGKSTLARTVLRLIEPASGRIVFDGADITALNAADMSVLRRRMQIIFQDPYASLNPRKSVFDILALPLRVHGLGESEIERRVPAMMERVGLRTGYLSRYPHQFSGGQRQRIGIARALILEPQFIVCDEPVSALDVSIQAQILALLAELKRNFGLTYLFISHDIGVVGHFCDRVAVMYMGRIVEQGLAQEVLLKPRHPYTRALLSAVPRLDDQYIGQRIELAGEQPSALAPPAGCHFHPRCPLAVERCGIEIPDLRELVPGHRAACHLAASP